MPPRSGSCSSFPTQPSGSSSTALILNSATLCRNSPRPAGTWRSGRSSDGARAIMSSSSTRSSTSGLDKMAGRSSCRPRASRASSAKIWRSGVEYYTDLGPLQSWLPFNEQQHNIYAVVDFKIGRFDVNAGVGYGLTPGLDRLMYKMIIGTDLTEGEPSKSPQAPKSLRRPESRLSGSSRP